MTEVAALFQVAEHLLECGAIAGRLGQGGVQGVPVVADVLVHEGIVETRQQGGLEFFGQAAQGPQACLGDLGAAGTGGQLGPQAAHLVTGHRHHAIDQGRALPECIDGHQGGQAADDQSEQYQQGSAHLCISMEGGLAGGWSGAGRVGRVGRAASGRQFNRCDRVRSIPQSAPYNAAMKDSVRQRFGGIDRLYGTGALDRLWRRHVCVIGLGGVGSWLVEALVRSGIGGLTLIDGDDICLSNSNRQLHALDGQFGRSKVEVMAERCRAINPDLDCRAVAEFLTPATLDDRLDGDCDLVIDACDAFRVKVETIAHCRRRKRRIITIGAAGGRSDPTQIRVRDLSRTEHDAMLALIRKKLRAEFGFPRNRDRYFGVPAVYSLENVIYPQADGSVCGQRPSQIADAGLKLDCGQGLGAATHVTGAFAFAAVGKALPLLLADP